MTPIQGKIAASEDEGTALESRIQGLGFPVENGAAVWRGRHIEIPEVLHNADLRKLNEYIIDQIQILLSKGFTRPSPIKLKEPLDYSVSQSTLAM